MRVSILISVIAFLTVSCSENPTTHSTTPLNGELAQNQNLVSKINFSPNRVSIGGVEYSVEPYVWKDFMPSTNSSVRLNSNNTLIRKDGTEIQNIEIIQQYIIKGNKIWVPDNVKVKQNQSSPEKLHIVSHEGPTWTVGSKVNIGLKIKDRETGKIFLLSVPDVTIAETH